MDDPNAGYKEVTVESSEELDLIRVGVKYDESSTLYIVLDEEGYTVLLKDLLTHAMDLGWGCVQKVNSHKNVNPSSN